MKTQLRDEHGGLIGGLVVDDYVRGIEDFETGAPWPDLTSASYDLGRQRAAEKHSEEQAVKDWIARQQAQTHERMRALLSPEDFAEFEKKISEIDARAAKAALSKGPPRS